MPAVPAHAGIDAVVARTDDRRARPGRGVALLTLTTRLNRHPAFGVLNPRLADSAMTLLPPPGFVRSAIPTPRFSVYTRCPSG